MPLIPGVIASEETAHLQPQPPIMDTVSGAVVISGGTTSGSNSIVQLTFYANPYGHPATSFGVTAFSGSPLVAVSGATVSGASSPLTLTFPFAANGLYEFRGTATNSYGTSQYGNQSNQIEPFVATPTPSGLSVSTVDTQDVQFTFNQISSATSYVISATGTLINPTTGIPAYDSATSTFSGAAITYSTVTGVLNHGYQVGMPYEFYAQSQNFAGTSASGANIQLTPNPYGPPKAPVFTAVAQSSNSQIAVTITPDTNPLDNLPNQGYVVGDFEGNFGSETSSATSVTLSTSNPIQPISSINVVAKGSYIPIGGTNPVNTSTSGTPITLYFPPGAPTGVSATVTSSGTGWDNPSANATVAVSWSAPPVNTQYSQPTGYIVTAMGTDSSSVTQTVSYGTNSVNLTGSYNVNIAYTVSVCAYNAAGTTCNNVAPATVEPYAVVAPGAVTSLGVSALSTSAVLLNWTNPTSGGPYDNLYIYSTPSASFTPTTVTSGNTGVSVNGTFALGQSYTFTVYTLNAGGIGSTTSTSITPNPMSTVNQSGGTHTSDGTYEYIYWTSAGTLAITNVALANSSILAVGGGGGGGAFKTISAGVYDSGGGGGAGQVLDQFYGSIPIQTYTVSVGAGGAAGSSSNGGTGGQTKCVNSSSVSLFGVNGGGGGGYNGAGSAGANGGGGAGIGSAGGAGNNASQGQPSGYNGGAGYSGAAPEYFAGGGGGAGGAGVNGQSSADGGPGIAATDWSSATGTGASGYYGGGGGGGAYSNYAGSVSKGGTGGGGNGGSQTNQAVVGSNGSFATGGGGGGAGGGSFSSTAGSGGSGVFAIRWPVGTANYIGP